MYNKKKPNFKGFGDFVISFPKGSKIGADQYLVISLTGAKHFAGYYPKKTPDYEIPYKTFDDPNVPNIDPSGYDPDSAGAGFLDNRAEDLTLFSWDGKADSPVIDLDSFYWKSNTSKSKYFAAHPNRTKNLGFKAQDKDEATQQKNSFNANYANYCWSFHRILKSEGSQQSTSGNGVDGSDQTSEDFNETWHGRLLPSPGAKGL